MILHNGEVGLMIPELIEETRSLWNTGKKVMVQVAWNLHRLRGSDVWQGHETFPKFVEAELDIKQSQTSKLLTIADYFLREYTPEQIGAVDAERLYAAARLEGSVEENLERARLWSRDDFKKQKAEDTPHEPKWVTYCDVCKLSQSNHG